MADYKHRAGSKKKSRGNANCSIWFAGGVVAGAFIVGLLWLQLGSNLGSSGVPGIPKPKHNANTAERETPKPTFEFYTILPEMEVVIPDEELVAPDASGGETGEKETTPQPLNENASYILQMGSFRRFEDADRMKARLALIGIEAEIQKVSINNRDTFHRVRSGPYRDQGQLNEARKLAKENNIATMVIKLKQ
jgi:cell division protein FtsN